jgi:hypothetical protein
MRYIALLLLSVAPASAAPYFRPLDFSHPQPIVGALIDPTNLGQSSAASLLPIFTHSPKDGCLLPNIVCEDWTPLALGASMNAGKVTFDVAPLANVLPWMQNGLNAVVPDSWTATRKLLASNPDQSVTFSAGPVWEYSQLRNKGALKLFSGLALHF